MTGWLTLRRGIIVVVLTLAWCGLWGTLSVANLASGLALSIAVLAAGIGTVRRSGGVRLVPLLELVWLVSVDLARSTIDVAVEILTPTDRTDEAVIAVDLPAASRQHLLLLTIAITLTPGTAVVDADPESGRLHLHLLHSAKREATIAHAERLARLAGEALQVHPMGVPG